ncbi:uncharacterized protein BDZ99DRAFT_515692 [Mytilinidion resinicola]|uniref:Aerobic respiration control sensor protein arcB n=1 Tax=Mytilinidion resinicola TaxID=574789 RepID=A0A6A6Z2H8_9PEZI|nr:uncharacterized protein BDZ99DRAFT_515692 [Mytilinidion resinicola]KAF2814929.1 hypothetical protein BDZ99DRAFT_515692 [Mytilinidion resinicola]
MTPSVYARGVGHRRGIDGGNGLATLGSLELLAQDPRPTFILDIASSRQASQPSPIVYRNPALHGQFALNELISGRAIGHTDLDYIGFRDWAVDQQEHKNHWSAQPRRSFAGISWIAYTVRSRFRIISGQPEDKALPEDPGTIFQEEDKLGLPQDSSKSERSASNGLSREEDYDDEDSASITSTERHAFGCTDLSVPEKRFSPFVKFFRSVDWGSTILGPIDEWPLQLHQMCNFLMNDPTPAYVLWGSELIVLYNEAAISVLLDRHPRCIGLPLQEVYPEVWDQISILIRKVQKTGKAVRVEDVPMLLQRHGRMDECFFSFQYQPIADEKGSVLGIYEGFVDVTRQNHAARRMSLLLQISSCSSVAKDMSDFWKLLIEAFDTSEVLPFAMLYTLQDVQHTSLASGSDASSSDISDTGRYCSLEGQLGIPEDHTTYVTDLNLSAADSAGYGPAMNQALEGQTVFLTIEDGTLPAAFVQGIDRRGITAPVNTVVVWPICPRDTVGFLIMGLNPHLGVDENFRGFLDIMSRQIATSAVMLFEDEVRHRERVAQELQLTATELMRSETRFQRMADNSLVGILSADPMGNIMYANQAFHDITNHDQSDKTMQSWVELFRDDFVSSLKAAWEQLHENRESIALEYPLKKPWTKVIGSGQLLKGPTWVLVSAFVEENADGSVKGSLAMITDISQQKWAEEHQKRRVEEAMEMKRQQEAFVDMTSHEIRNPLSAIIQSADSISTTLTTWISSSASQDGRIVTISRELLEDSLDAADTITLCAQHQKRVVDDILTLSKMDSDMLLVTPVDVEPLQIINSAIRMFETESMKEGIAVEVDLEPSFHQLGLQNATRSSLPESSQKKRVTIRVGGSLQIPDDTKSGIEYVHPPETIIPNAFMEGSSTGSRMCFMRIAVHDTGPGLNPAERERLFKRFGQASPKTEVEYGGSGLGLFISKKLSELQGGGIGLASEPGCGSTFAFYVLVQRRDPPVSNLDTAKGIAQNTASLRKLALPKHRLIHMLSNPRPSPPVLEAVSPSELPSQMTFPVEKTPIQRKLAILVVEDNLVNQRVLCKQLRYLGHIVNAANHGKEALDFLEKSIYWTENKNSGEPLDIILMDTEMPVMDGLTCARRIREAESQGLSKGHVPIISVTANARSEQSEIAASAGMDDAISKPFRVADLEPKMYQLVRKYGS